ncbi:hypothetical protein RHSIM_Rhsim01G0022400 [Rhododendron simsii]|uniref:Uncharacterized protein n=1 Tax=Rhododendron simsii TaxID=118357 RepID=A0A834HIX1_RHOSS|nr:hypothetical protein RHSIM_Rhsim01G0022400 [Rhododendron simsii]
MKDHYVNHLQVLEMMNDKRNVFEKRSNSSEYQKEEILSLNNLVSENTSDKENKSGTEDESVPPFAESKDVKLDLILADRMAKNQNDDTVQDEVSDEGWQEARFSKRQTRDVGINTALSKKKNGLIKQGRGEWVIWLSQRFPCLVNKTKNWSHIMIGQFDVLGYCLKLTKPDVQISPSRN